MPVHHHQAAGTDRLEESAELEGDRETLPLPSTYKLITAGDKSHQKSFSSPFRSFQSTLFSPKLSPYARASSLTSAPLLKSQLLCAIPPDDRSSQHIFTEWQLWLR